MREIQKWVGEDCYMEVRRLLMLLTQWEKKQRERSCKGILCQDGEVLSTDDHHGPYQKRICVVNDKRHVIVVFACSLLCLCRSDTLVLGIDVVY